MKERLEGKVDYLVRGTARSRYSSSNPVIFCHAGGNFELIDVRTGQQAATYKVPLSSRGAKGAGQTELDAGTKALSVLGEQVQTEFMKKVDEVFLIE